MQPRRRRFMPLYRRILTLSLLAAASAPIAAAGACPLNTQGGYNFSNNASGNLSAYLAIASGSCTLPGALGALSNIRFSAVAAGGAAIPDSSNFNIDVSSYPVSRTQMATQIAWASIFPPTPPAPVEPSPSILPIPSPCPPGRPPAPRANRS